MSGATCSGAEFPSRYLSRGCWAPAPRRTLDSSAFIWLAKRVSQHNLEILRLEDFYFKFADTRSFAKIASASRRQEDKGEFVEAGSLYTASVASPCPELRSGSRRTDRACGPLRSQYSAKHSTRKQRDISAPLWNSSF